MRRKKVSSQPTLPTTFVRIPFRESSRVLSETADCTHKIAQLNESRDLQSSQRKQDAKALTEVGLNEGRIKSTISAEYTELWDAFSDAMEALSFSNNKIMLKSAKYSVEREREQPEYTAKLERLLAVGVRFTKKIGDTKAHRARVFCEDNFQYLSTELNAYKAALEKCSPKTQPIADTISCISAYLTFLSDVYKTTTQLETLEERAYNLTEQIHIKLISAHTNVEQVITVVSVNVMLMAINRIYEFIGMTKSMVDGARDALHNLENALIAARMRMLANSDQDVMAKYLEVNRGFLHIQITLLEFALTTSLQKIVMWPVLNRDLMRIQIKESGVSTALLLGVKKQDLLIFNSGFANERAKMFAVLTESDKIRIDIVNNGSNSNTHKESVTKLCSSELYHNNALVKLLVLGNLIQCNLTKISQRVKKPSNNVKLLQEDILDQIRCIKNFVDNLKEVRLTWGGILFKFLNNIFFFQVYIQEVISATEHAFLACEILFQKTDQNNLHSKHQVIELQLELLQMQKTVMKFANQTYGAEYLLYFYFKRATENKFICYNTIERNQDRFAKGDVLNIIEGIPLKEALKYNETRRLQLEAIPLEFLANQRTPQEEDYQRAISGKELEKYLKKWEKEAAHEKALEDKRSATQTKKATPKRTSNQTQSTPSLKEETKTPKTTEVVQVKSNTKCSTDPLTVKMNELISILNPRVFNADQVKRVINELNQYTFDSDNDDRVFNALSTIGDSYSIIAGYHLNRSKKEPEELIVNLKLAMNFYSRAEMVLSRNSPDTMERHEHYYTWLKHSVGIQCDLLEEYTRKFIDQHERLQASRQRKKDELGDEWYTRCLRPGWKKSTKTLRTEALEGAFNALKSPLIYDATAANAPRAPGGRSATHDHLSTTMQALQEKCRELYNLIHNKVIHFAANQHKVFSFEHHLHQAGIRTLPDQQINYKYVVKPKEPAEQEIIEVVREEAPVPTSNALSLPQPLLPPFAYNQVPFMTAPYGYPLPQFMEAYYMNPYLQTYALPPQIVYPQLEFFPPLPDIAMQLDYNSGAVYPAFGPQLALYLLNFPVPPFAAVHPTSYACTAAVKYPPPDQLLLQMDTAATLHASKDYQKPNYVGRS